VRAFGTEHSAFTIEGRIEAAGQLARGVSRASETQWRSVSRLAAWTGFAIVVICVATWGIHHFA